MDRSWKLFSQIGHYALRTTVALALEEEGACLRASDIAARTQMPQAYASKVLRRLTESGLLVSQKGHHGGFRLAKDPARICFAEVLAAVDALPADDTCVFGWGKCNAAIPCPLHPAWSELSRRVVDWAQTTSVADALPRSTRKSAR